MRQQFGLMSIQAITIRRFVRRVRGRSKAQLVEGEDGFFYVCKHQDPQGRRTVINEWLSRAVLEAIEVATPKAALLTWNEDPDQLSQPGSNVIKDNCAERKAAIYFASRCPVSPFDTPIYDFLPTPLL